MPTTEAGRATTRTAADVLAEALHATRLLCNPLMPVDGDLGERYAALYPETPRRHMALHDADAAVIIAALQSAPESDRRLLARALWPEFEVFDAADGHKAIRRRPALHGVNP
jgi:hypothetical protein